MVSLKMNFVHSLLQGRVYHFPTSHYVNPLRCPSRSFDCYFEPPTNCSGASSRELGTPARKVHRKVEESRILWCFELPRRRLSKLAGLRAVHSRAWYHAQVAAFLFRPNAALRNFRREVEPKMEARQKTHALRPPFPKQRAPWLEGS